MSQHTLSGNQGEVVHLSLPPVPPYQGRYATTPLSFFSPPLQLLVFPLARGKLVELLAKTHTHTHTKNRVGGRMGEGARTPWLLHHYTGKEHPKQARPDRTHAHTHTQV